MCDGRIGPPRRPPGSPIPTPISIWPTCERGLCSFRFAKAISSGRHSSWTCSGDSIRKRPGELAGQQGSYVPALERLLKSARDWPAAAYESDWATFAGRRRRNADAAPLDALAAPLWPEPVTLGGRLGEQSSAASRAGIRAAAELASARRRRPRVLQRLAADLRGRFQHRQTGRHGRRRDLIASIYGQLTVTCPSAAVGQSPSPPACRDTR